MRVVIEESKGSGWVTIFCVLGLLVVGGLAYQHRDRFMPAKKVVKVNRGKMNQELEGKFFAARDGIVAGRYDAASAILTSIDTDKVPQPTRNWITMQNGLSRLLAGKLPEAQAEFTKVEERGPYTTEGPEAKLATFFVDTARLAASAEPVKADVVKNYNLESTEAFALLVFGLKDWELGQYEDASTFLTEFRAANPPDSDIWLRRYRPIGDTYAESFAAFKVANDAAKGAGAHEKKVEALAAVREAKEKVSGQPGLLAKLSTIESELKSQVDKVDEEMSKQSAEAEAADRAILNDVKARVASYNEKFQFADGHQIVFTATVEGEKAKTELDEWFKRTQWLSKFKSTLAKDISAAGYPKALTKKDSSALPAGVKSADDNQLLTPANVPVQWTDIASDSIIAMAKEFIGKETEPDAVAERKWLLGNFIYQLGRKPEALALMQEAAKAKAEYKDSLRLFPDGKAK